MTYQDLMNQAKQALIEHNIYDGFAFRLMFDLCQLQDIDLYMVKDESVSDDFAQDYQNRVQRLCENEPLGYVVGYEWFYGRPLKVDSRVLIPREETQELIGNILSDIDHYFNREDLVIFDIACGSGCCGLTMKCELPNSQVYLSDISQEALDVTHENAQLLDVDVNLLWGDMAKPFVDNNLKADLIICNPPYILDSEEVMESVYEFEPHVALFGGEDGLKFYRSLLDDYMKIANKKSLLAMEIGYQQKESITKEILDRYPFAKVEVIKDLNGLDRMCFVYFDEK